MNYSFASAVAYIADTTTLSYDGANQLIGVSGSVSASFRYDGDGKRVKTTVNGDTIYYIGNYVEVLSAGRWIINSYYYAGGTRVAMRKGLSIGGDLHFLLGDHLGSTSMTAARNRLTTPTQS